MSPQLSPGGIVVEFIGESHLARIKSLIAKAEQFDAAVAYWGNGAVEALKLDKAPKGSTLVCNLFSAGCNPFEIEKLFKLKRFTILNHAGLHAKVYWTPNGACIGSSNASGAGLGIDEKNDIQREANVFSNDSTFVRDARFWLDKIIKESTQVGASEIKGAQRAYLPRPSGTWELIDLPISMLKNEKLAVLVWSRQATEDEMDQVYKFPDTSIKNWNCFLDSHAHVRQYPYGYHALEFNLSDDRRRLGPFQGMLRIPEQTRWRRVRGEGGMTYYIVWTEEVFQRQKRWLVPGLPPFSIGQRSKDEINKRLFERDRGIGLEHCFDLGENGLLSWEPLHKLLVR